MPGDDQGRLGLGGERDGLPSGCGCPEKQRAHRRGGCVAEELRAHFAKNAEWLRECGVRDLPTLEPPPGDPTKSKRIRPTPTGTILLSAHPSFHSLQIISQAAFACRGGNRRPTCFPNEKNVCRPHPEQRRPQLHVLRSALCVRPKFLRVT